jgi:ketosteroid isomerase-like protein
VSQENIELVRRLYAELTSEGSTQEFEERLTDDAFSRFLDPGIEWAPVTHSLLAADSYRGFDGVRRFWREFLSTWETYRVELLRFDETGDQVAVVVHIVGRTHELEVDETGRRSLDRPRWAGRPRPILCRRGGCARGRRVATIGGLPAVLRCASSECHRRPLARFRLCEAGARLRIFVPTVDASASALGRLSVGPSMWPRS